MRTKRILITGGAGFIGCNATRFFVTRNWKVTVLDNLSRHGGEQNLRWLRESATFDFEEVDIRNRVAVDRILAEGRFDAVLHLAAQVAVTTSVADPSTDFTVNALGTFHVLDAIRRHCPEAVFIFASTNKVYGKIAAAEYELRGNRYTYLNRPNGISEDEPLDFLSPYGCSKGSADQYTLDFARIYQIRATSFRQSCIYGPRQFGVEDQGWVAWFVIAHALDRQITIYGDGKQTRDILFIEDLLDAYLLAYERRDRTAGQIYNIGGGPENQLSLIELMQILKQAKGKEVQHSFADWRPGDQKVFVADIRKARTDLGWEPAHGCREGVEKLITWVDSNLGLFRE